MQLIAESTSFVMRGNWNPAILQPAWLVTHALEGNPDDFPVSMEFTAIAGIPPKYTLAELKFAPSFDNLQIFPTTTTAESLARLEHVAQSILRALPHTPVSAFGQNFEFVEPTVGGPATSLFVIGDRLTEKLSIDANIVSTTLMSGLQIENRTLNVKRTLDSDGNMKLAMNFHYVTDRTDQAAELLDNSFVSNFEIAQEIAEIYDNLEA